MAWRTIPSPLSKMKRRLDSIDATRGLQDIRVATWEESGVLCFPSRGGLTPRGILECNPEIPVQGGTLLEGVVSPQERLSTEIQGGGGGGAVRLLSILRFTRCFLSSLRTWLFFLPSSWPSV